GELARKFGFVARTPDPTSTDLDVREGLPIGMHLTTDPITGVPFVVTACALCHAERIAWKGGEATVIRLANKPGRIPASDAAFAHVIDEPGSPTAKLGRLAAEAAAARHLAWPEQYAGAFVGAAVATLRQRAADRAELRERTEHGPPGRVATIES